MFSWHDRYDSELTSAYLMISGIGTVSFLCSFGDLDQPLLGLKLFVLVLQSTNPISDFALVSVMLPDIKMEINMGPYSSHLISSH